MISALRYSRPAIDIMTCRLIMATGQANYRYSRRKYNVEERRRQSLHTEDLSGLRRFAHSAVVIICPYIFLACTARSTETPLISDWSSNIE